MKKRRIVSNLILVIAIAVFLFSAYKLYTIFAEYNKGDHEYETIIEEAVTQTVVTLPEEEGKEEVIFRVDFEKLLSANKETVAWIRFDEPAKISYPVVQATDNDKYLRTTFEGKTNSSGAIFMDAANAGDFSDLNTFLYGHNMKNGSMFGQLRKYKSESFYRENPYFYIYTPDGKELKYQIFTVAVVEDTSDSYKKMYADDNEYLAYLKLLKSIALYDTEVEVSAESQLVSLSTCTNVTETQRLLVHGVKVGEKVVGE